MNKEALVLFGGSFNPPTASHVAITLALARKFPRVVVIPCSTHPFKQQTAAEKPEHRVVMSTLAFSRLAENVEVDFSDFRREQSRRTFERQEQYETQGEVWHAIGADLIVGAHEEKAEVQRWAQAERIWREYRWVIIGRLNREYLPGELPPQHVLFPEPVPSYSSTEVRERARQGRSLVGMVPGAIAEYITANRLYLK